MSWTDSVQRTRVIDAVWPSLESPKLTEGERAAFSAYLLDYANRLRTIRTVSDIELGYIEKFSDDVLHCSISFKVCGLNKSALFAMRPDGTIEECTRNGVLETLEAWQAGTCEEEEEERFRLE